MPSASRLVTSRRQPGQAASRRPASSAHASARCSQLSSMQQRAPVGQRLGDGGAGRLAAGVLQAERVGHGVRHALGLANRGQRRQPDAIGEASRQAGGHLGGQAGLAAAARAGEGDQPARRRVGLEERNQRGQFRLPPEEGRARSGRVTRRPYAKIGEHSVTLRSWQSRGQASGPSSLHYTSSRRAPAGWSAYVPPWKAVTAAVACMLPSTSMGRDRDGRRLISMIALGSTLGTRSAVRSPLVSCPCPSTACSRSRRSPGNRGWRRSGRHSFRVAPPGRSPSSSRNRRPVHGVADAAAFREHDRLALMRVVRQDHRVVVGGIWWRVLCTAAGLP